MEMELSKQIIIENLEDNEDFSYYLKIIEKIKNNVYSNPDITVESCKALYEGVAKTILRNLNPNSELCHSRKIELQPLIYEALLTLENIDPSFERGFVRQCSHLVKLLGEIRNDRCDISHGQSVPKLCNSTELFSALTARVTDALINYVLEVYFSIETDKVKYDDNLSFNNFLDEIPLEGKVFYSKALYDQDYISYVTQLEEFQFN